MQEGNSIRLPSLIPVLQISGAIYLAAEYCFFVKRAAKARFKFNFMHYLNNFIFVMFNMCDTNFILKHTIYERRY